MQPLRLMESPLIQEVIILKVSRKFSCAMKTQSYDYLIITITSNRVLIATCLAALKKYYHLITCYHIAPACACRSHWQEINCKLICLGLVILPASGRFLSLVCPFYLYNRCYFCIKFMTRDLSAFFTLPCSQSVFEYIIFLAVNNIYSFH